jgi:hypothetical protein
MSAARVGAAVAFVVGLVQGAAFSPMAGCGDSCTFTKVPALLPEPGLFVVAESVNGQYLGATVLIRWENNPDFLWSSMVLSYDSPVGPAEIVWEWRGRPRNVRLVP